MDPFSTTESFSFLMYKFGPAIVIISSFLMLFIVILFYFLKEQQATNSKIMKEHQQLLERLMKKNDSKDDSKEDTKELVKIYTKVITNMNRVMNEYSSFIHPLRIGIYLLHNGSYGITKFPFLKFSCVGESIRNSFFNHVSNHTDYPVNLLSEFITDLSNNNALIKIGNNNECFRDTIINKLIINVNNNYIVKSILSSDSILIGFILIEFDPDVFNENTKVNILKNTEMLSNNISPILEFSDFNSIYKESVGDNT